MPTFDVFDRVRDRNIRRVLAMLLAAWMLAAATPRPAAADARWVKLRTSGVGPSERSRPAVAALGDEIFVFGGGFDDFSSGEFVFYNDLFVLDTGARRWRELHPAGELPAPRAFSGHASLDSGAGFVVFGGGEFRNDLSVTAYGDLWLYSRRERRWTQLSDASVGPGIRFDPKLWTDGDTLYVFGGLTETFAVADDLWSFDLRSRTWSLLKAPGAAGSPPARGVARGPDKAYRGKLYFYGGEGGPDTDYKIFDDVWAYDIERAEWRDLTPPAPYQLEPARNHNSVARVGHYLYAYGGDVPGGVMSCGAPFPQNPIDELWRFDLRRDRWQPVDDPRGDAPPPLKRHESVTIGSAMYLLAGFDFAAVGGSEACQVWNLDVYVYR